MCLITVYSIIGFKKFRYPAAVLLLFNIRAAHMPGPPDDHEILTRTAHFIILYGIMSLYIGIVASVEEKDRYSAFGEGFFCIRFSL